MALALLLLLGQYGSGLFPDAPNTDGDAALQEEVEELLERRIDLNRASARELLVIPWLSPFLAYRIAAVRDSVGGFSKVEQLRQVPGMTAEAFDGLRPFLRFGRCERILTGRAVSRLGSDSLGNGIAGLRAFNRLEIQSSAV